jgi:outer membrane lipoprotein SlyB
MKKTTAYSVRVRMQDGTSRTIEQSAAPMVGSKVTLDGNTMRPA